MNLVDRIFFDPISKTVKMFSRSGVQVQPVGVEYAYNTSSNTTTSDVTSFAKGEQGALTRAISSKIYRRVEFETQIITTNLLMPQVSFDQLKWFNLVSWIYNGANAVEPFHLHNVSYFGMGFAVDNPTPFTNTKQVDMSFGSVAAYTGSNGFGGASYPWPASGLYWRAAKFNF